MYVDLDKLRITVLLCLLGGVQVFSMECLFKSWWTTNLLMDKVSFSTGYLDSPPAPEIQIFQEVSHLVEC